jgi:hypothetical protein
MNKKMAFLSIIVILVLALSGCQAATSAQASTTGSTSQFNGTPPAGFSGTPPAGFNPGQASGASAAVTPNTASGPSAATATATPTNTSRSATAVPVTAAAVSQAKAYFADLQNKDFTAASKLISIVSLSYAGLTRSQAASSLQAQSLAGATWSNLQIVDSQVFSDDTILVHVTYTVSATSGIPTTASGPSAPTTASGPSATTATTQKDEIWAFRLEGGSYLYNWENFIDTKTVEVDAQTANHITLQPTKLVRFTDRLELHFIMQNKTSDVVYFVQSYDTLAIFHFGDQAVEASKNDNSIVISGLHTSYDEKIVVKGLYASYPTWVEIKKYTSYYPNPWYTFQF